MTSRVNRYPAGADDNDELDGVTCPVSSAKNYQTNATAPFQLRATSVLRRENGVWRIVLRHADPIATADASRPMRGR
jgi:hypothetical protein